MHSRSCDVGMRYPIHTPIRKEFWKAKPANRQHAVLLHPIRTSHCILFIQSHLPPLLIGIKDEKATQSAVNFTAATKHLMRNVYGLGGSFTSFLYNSFQKLQDFWTLHTYNHFLFLRIIWSLTFLFYIPRNRAKLSTKRKRVLFRTPTFLSFLCYLNIDPHSPNFHATITSSFSTRPSLSRYSHFNSTLQ